MTSVENGQLALEAIVTGEQRFDIVLMDVQMPVLDGLAATERIRNVRTARELPIIAMTAHAMAEERMRCLAAGMNDHIAKPINPAMMIATIVRWSPEREKPVTDAVPREHAAPSSLLAAALPAFDISSALGRCSGDEVFLRRLFARFAQQFASAGTTLERFLANGETRDAGILTHTLGGTAAQIGAIAVARAARELEVALRSGAGFEDGALLNALRGELDDTLAQLAALPAPQSGGQRAPAITATPAAPLLVDDIDDMLRQVGEAIAMKQFRAGKLFAGVIRAFDGTADEVPARQIAEHIERLDFAAASESLRLFVSARAAARMEIR